MNNQKETLTTTALNQILRVQLTTALLKGLGIMPAFEARNATHWYKSDIPSICRALRDHFQLIGDQHLGARK